MIFTIMFNVFYFVLYGVLNAVLPVSTGLPSDVAIGFSYVFGYLYAFSFLLPPSTIITVLGLSLVFEGSIQVWHGIHWAVKKIPFLHIK